MKKLSIKRLLIGYTCYVVLQCTPQLSNMLINTNRFGLMIKLSLILLLIFPFFIHAEPDDEKSYETYVVLKNPSSPNLKDFPFDEKKSSEDDAFIEKHLCPAETDDDVRNSEKASEKDYKLKYCLFEKNFDNGNDKVCKKEVKPVLIEINMKCGFLNQYDWHAFSFFDCGIAVKDFPLNFSRTATTNRYYYKICYDTNEKHVMWTKHEIQTPELLQNAHLKNRLSTTELAEISTNAFFMDDNQFLTLKKKYDAEKNKGTPESGNFIMVPRPLVPLEHLAFVLWKKTANHYMNMAPLWVTLVPLMIAIDERVQKVQQKLASRDPNSYSKLQIYTRVDLVPESKKIQTLGMRFYYSELFKENIWYKFIYNEKEKSGVLVIIHNTPGKPPSPSKGCIFGVLDKPCQFENWSDDENINQGITDEVKKYAYCCKPWRHNIVELFVDDPVNLVHFLNMNGLENLIQDSPEPSSLHSPKKGSDSPKEVSDSPKEGTDSPKESPDSPEDSPDSSKEASDSPKEGRMIKRVKTENQS